MQFQSLILELIEPLALVAGEVLDAGQGADLVVEAVEPTDQIFLPAPLVGREGPESAGRQVIEEAARQSGFPALPGVLVASTPGQDRGKEGQG